MFNDVLFNVLLFIIAVSDALYSTDSYFGIYLQVLLTRVHLLGLWTVSWPGVM